MEVGERRSQGEVRFENIVEAKKMREEVTF